MNYLKNISWYVRRGCEQADALAHHRKRLLKRLMLHTCMWSFVIALATVYLNFTHTQWNTDINQLQTQQGHLAYEYRKLRAELAWLLSPSSLYGRAKDIWHLHVVHHADVQPILVDERYEHK